MKAARIICIAQLCAMLCAIASFAQSQNSIECIYKWSQNHKKLDPQVTEVGYIMLDIQGDRAIVQDYSAYQLDSVRSIPQVSQEVISQYTKQCSRVVTFFEPMIEQNFSSRQFNVVETVVPERYRYTEPFAQGWVMGDESQVIAGYPCTSATIEYAGRMWKVWFTEEIPTPAGPWKLVGLPGLILRAEDTEGEVSFDIAEIRNGNGISSALPEDKSIIKGTRGQIVELRNRVMPNPMKNIPVEAISMVTVKKNPDGSREISFNGVTLRQPKYGYIAIEKR